MPAMPLPEMLLVEEMAVGVGVMVMVAAAVGDEDVEDGAEEEDDEAEVVEVVVEDEVAEDVEELNVVATAAVNAGWSLPSMPGATRQVVSLPEVEHVWPMGQQSPPPQSVLKSGQM